MKRSRWLQTSLVAVLAAAAVGSACGNEVAPALVVTGNIVPEEQDGTCTVRTQGGGQQEMRFAGVLDLSVADRYVAFLGVQNNFDQFENVSGFQAEDGRLDPSTITIEGAEVTLEINPGLVLTNPDVQTRLQQAGLGGLPVEYTVAGASSIEPNSGGAVELELIPSKVGRALRGINQMLSLNADVEVIAEVRVVGKRQDGREIKSGPFRYPIRLCNNCLVNQFFPEALATNPFNPPNPDDALTEDDLGIRCFVGQDDVVTNAVCGAFFADDACKLARCLGSPQGEDLTCESDGTSIGPNQPLPQ